MGTQIHPTALVESGAELGEGVEVGAYSVIGPHVRIGDGTRIAPHVVIEGRTEIGRNCSIYQFASLGSPPQDLKYRGEPSTLIIGDDNTIRESASLNPGTEHGHMTTTVGVGNLFMAYSHVGHDSVVGDHNVFANCASLAGHVTVGSHVIIGGLVGIHQFTRLGDYSFLGGGSMVNLDIPPFCIGQGDRCSLRGVNVVGLKRAGFSEEDIAGVRSAYRHLFPEVGDVQERVQSLASTLLGQQYVQELVEFVRSSSRGIAQPHRSLRGA